MASNMKKIPRAASPPLARDEFEYFWQTHSPFSQWHRSTYTLDGVTFTCAEQGMMYGKAVLFGDERIAQEILRSDNPKTIKELGRQVARFDGRIWEQHRENIVYRNNMGKFGQNPHLRAALIATSPRLLVEASPYDRIWGIGLSESDARRVGKAGWKGQNLLGYILTRVREDLGEARIV
eukprot:comp27685_c0_seq1/m.47175 comp27685_c0_seq1/g.47175  ORF comp27685_c0_seq1/g.47175 comp27685_c0_seq1/m.47175 type:complete len:179 (-) comp27685_c0_seq1:301-837(-)